MQGQPHYVWPPSFALAGAYLDQLERCKGLAAERIAAARGALEQAEKAPDTERAAALGGLADELETDAGSAADGAKVRTLAAAVRDLSAVKAAVQ